MPGTDMTEDDSAPIVHHDANSLPELPPAQGTEALVTVILPQARTSRFLSYVIVAVLCFINLLNYMDRFTVAGVLPQLQHDFNIDNSLAGLLQTAFICSYMILSPIFGYLGDRWPRKWIMVLGILLWSGVTLASSFCRDDQYYLFLFLRACVGIGEASYSTIAPTIIADLFVKDERSSMLGIFYFAIPVGSGLGYIVGSRISAAFNYHWRWAFRFTPILGVIAVLLIVVCVREPRRGEAEGDSQLRATTWLVDIKQLLKNKSFIFTSLGFTCVAFVAGALSLWAPTFMIYSIQIQSSAEMQHVDVAWIFGIITCAAGTVGVIIGSQTSKMYRRINPRADPLVCASGMLLCTPFLFFALIVSEYHTLSTWILIFIGETMLCLNWSIVADIILYVVVPTRRSTAQAFQILLSHALGDAGSPYLVGAISDMTRHLYQGETVSKYKSLQAALYSTTFACVLGGAFFLAAACFVEKDKKRVETITKKSGPVIIDDERSDD